MERYIKLDGTFNFRDIGGFSAAGGRHVKMGVLYRADALHKLSERDLERLSAMKIRTVVDFRAPDEAAAQPDRLPQGVRTVVLAPHAELARQASASRKDDAAKVAGMVARAETEEGRAWLQANLDSMQGQMRALVTSESGAKAFSALLHLLLEPEAAPLVFHCKGGKDRTGWAAALILSALGVDREEIVAGYLKTAEYNQARNAQRLEQYRQHTDNELVLRFAASLMQVKESYLRASFEEVDRLGGMEAYLRETLHFTEENTAQLRAKYLQ